MDGMDVTLASATLVILSNEDRPRPRIESRLRTVAS